MLSRAKVDSPTFSGLDEKFWAHYYEVVSKLSKKKIPVTTGMVTTMHKYFDHYKLPKPSANQIQALLCSPFNDGDLIRTFHLIRYFQLSSQGMFITNENIDTSGNVIRYIGADNWENVMCYMDSLLFAMFSNLDSFEPILFLSNQSADPLLNRLSTLLRVYVNLLRSGNIIRVDLTIQICDTLAKLGFTEAMSHKQQDAATLFEFLTEVLSMPLLTFKIDIQHGGKFNEEDDHKYSKERMLFVSLMEVDDENASVHSSSSNTGSESHDDEILLEECLENYFSNSISVKRELERRATLDSMASGKPSVSLVENIDDRTNLTQESPAKNSQIHTQVRTRSSTLSIWNMKSEDNSNNNPTKPKPKEVSLPAWMFLRLLPFYTDDNNVSISKDGNVNSTANSSREFANRRPVLPICLKRYSFENDRANRLAKKVIIPPVISLPSFVADDNDDNKASHNYKLILESAICHRGTTITSGHFVSVVRKNYNQINESDTEAYNAPWFLYDDVHKPKVVEKSFKEVFATEWPYILFYRLVSIGEVESSNNSIYSSTPTSVTNSPQVIVPQGSKGKYWAEENSSPIISASQSPSLKAETKSATSSLRQTLTNVSNPLPDTSPLDSKFQDIKDKYYWYVPDKNMNYYREDTLSKQSTRRSSVTAAYRRNSQWSNGKKPSISELEERLNKLPLDTSNINSINPKVQSAPHHAADVEDVISNFSLNDSESHHESAKHKSSGKHRHHRHLFPHETHDVNKSYKKSRKKRDAYKREKCIIT